MDNCASALTTHQWTKCLYNEEVYIWDCRTVGAVLEHDCCRTAGVVFEIDY